MSKVQITSTFHGMLPHIGFGPINNPIEADAAIANMLKVQGYPIEILVAAKSAEKSTVAVSQEVATEEPSEEAAPAVDESLTSTKKVVAATTAAASTPAAAPAAPKAAVSTGTATKKVQA